MDEQKCLVNPNNQKDEKNCTKTNLKMFNKFFKIIGENPEREGLMDTPKRVIKSWNKLFGGYAQDPKEVLSTYFEEDISKDQGMVYLRNIEFFSHCEHHMIPFFGKVHIAYIPDKRVIGISKLARLVEVFARRLQIQEKMTNQIADALQDELSPLGVMVVVEAQHLCMVARGVEKQNSIMGTSKVTGAFKNQDARSEFLTLIKG